MRAPDVAAPLSTIVSLNSLSVTLPGAIVASVIALTALLFVNHKLALPSAKSSVVPAPFKYKFVVPSERSSVSFCEKLKSNLALVKYRLLTPSLTKSVFKF